MPMNKYGEIVRKSESIEPNSEAQTPTKRWTYEKINTLYNVLRIVFFAYAGLMIYLAFYNSGYIYYEMNIGFVTVIYLTIIGVWSFFGGMNGCDGIKKTAIILFVVFAAGTGTAVFENYIYRGRMNGFYELLMIKFLGTSDFFVIKYTFLMFLVGLIFMLIPNKLGKQRREVIGL